jgi:hypothetical protein
MNTLVLLLAATLGSDMSHLPWVHVADVDRVELNHILAPSFAGRIIQTDQLLFWRWNKTGYVVDDWLRVSGQFELKPSPMFFMLDNRLVVIYTKYVVETTTDYDPEYNNRIEQPVSQRRPIFTTRQRLRRAGGLNGN